MEGHINPCVEKTIIYERKHKSMGEHRNPWDNTGIQAKDGAGLALWCSPLPQPYLVSLGIVLHPKERHSRICTRGEAGIC